MSLPLAFVSSAFTYKQVSDSKQPINVVFEIKSKDSIKVPQSPFNVIETHKKLHNKKTKKIHKQLNTKQSTVVTEQPQVQQQTTTQNNNVTNQSDTNTSPTKLSSGEESAKQEIAMAESSNSYTAVNGRYYGKYQLDISYLHGDLSPANQEKVFLQYCNQRYGSVESALAFRHIHNWY